MAFDNTVSTGNVLLIIITGIGWIVVLVRQSFTVGRLITRFENLQNDVSDIKESLKEQDKSSLDRVKSDALADGIITLLQYRVSHLEREMIRARANIHRLANNIHTELLKQEMEQDSDESSFGNKRS